MGEKSALGMASVTNAQLRKFTSEVGRRFEEDSSAQKVTKRLEDCPVLQELSLDALLQRNLDLIAEESESQEASDARVADLDAFKLFLDKKIAAAEYDSLTGKYEDTVFFAAKHGSVNCGMSYGCIGQVQYQMEGTRIIAMVQADELENLGAGNLEHW